MERKKFFDLLHRSGLRVTPQRIAICDQLVKAKDHPTANDLYNKLKKTYPSLSLATVYNNLEMLVQVGMVNALGSVGDDKVHYDANIQPHINLACVQCHRIIDFDSEQVKGLNMEVVEKSGYEIDGSRILYFGTCPDCLISNQKPRRQ